MNKKYKRLIKSNLSKTADDNVNNILDKVCNQLDVIKNDYYILLDNLNTLYTTYGDVYQQIEQTVKLPTKQDIEELVQMQEDMKNITQHLQDDNYVENYTDDSDINEETEEVSGFDETSFDETGFEGISE